ncbi:MAG: VOC family protein [Pseudomonadota bacterium]
MSARLEHANIAVRDVDQIVRFIRTALPDYAVRGEGTSNGRRWVHVGDDESYLAINQASRDPAEAWVPYAGKPGVNHLGFEVDDAAALGERLRAAGYTESTVANRHPYRQRVYFLDPEGNDWEFVQYDSDVPAERNDYALDG